MSDMRDGYGLHSHKPYLGIFKIRFIAGMQYRAAAWAGVATQFFWGAMQLLIFHAFYQSSFLNNPGAAAPMSFSQLADYIWMRQAFLALVMLWSMDNELLNNISSGNVAYELARPLSLYAFWFARILAFRISRTLLRCFPIFIVAFLLPGSWGFHLPESGLTLALFLPSLILSALLSTALSMVICLLTFITLSPVGSRLIMGAAAEFLMGAIIPIPFMPPLWQRITSFLPFRYTADFPFRVYSGNISGQEALFGLAIQVFWILALVFLGILGFRACLKRLVIQGG
jgi:ABC-2 type transport system permease protein